MFKPARSETSKSRMIRDLKMHRSGEAIPMTVVAPSLPVSNPPVASVRDTALDFTKGLLVLFMVLYHWANYFLGFNFGPEGKYYDYLRFLTPGFIFITGFMISYVLLQRYGGA